MKARVELYGSLKEKLGAFLEVEASTVAEVLKKLPPGTALATEERVLSSDEKLPEGRLAALPPVCGG
jgi:molybdopterin converting factor small subunit